MLGGRPGTRALYRGWLVYPAPNGGFIGRVYHVITNLGHLEWLGMAKIVIFPQFFEWTKGVGSSAFWDKPLWDQLEWIKRKSCLIFFTTDGLATLGSNFRGALPIFFRKFSASLQSFHLLKRTDCRAGFVYLDQRFRPPSQMSRFFWGGTLTQI